MVKAVKIFFSYSHRDEKLRDQMERHLSILIRQNLVELWHDRRIGPGEEFEDSISEHLNSANLILLLVSPDFLASEYCYGKEMMRALERHRRKEALVIPVILRPADWQDAPFGGLLALPKDGKPITLWSNRDAAFLDVTRGIRKAVEDSLPAPPAPSVHILIIDDMPDYASSLKDAMKVSQREWKVQQATSLKEAQALLNKSQFDAVIIDLRLENESDPKDASGLALAKSLPRDLPKILMSDYPTFEAIRESLAPSNGVPSASDFVAKQEGYETIVEATMRAIEKRRRVEGSLRPDLGRRFLE